MCVQLEWRIVVDCADIARVLDRIRRAEEALSTEPSTPRAQSGHGDAPTSLAPAAVECFVTVFDASGEQPEPRQAPTSRTHGGLVSMFADSFGIDRAGVPLSSFTRDCAGAASSTLLASVDAYLAANDVGVASHAKAQELATLDDSILTAFSPAADGNDHDDW
uniref:Uncharacterized protein n=1 Tax=Neobodo designis TaxID=312471 RepID=A0A7S1LAM2_NEODS